MSAVAAKHGKRKRLKGKVSFGSSSGASSNLPPQQGHGNKSHYEASGSITGWSAQQCSLHLRSVLGESGPSQEEDLLKKLQPEQARRVLAEYDMSTSFLERHRVFRQLHEGLYSFIYHEDADYCDGCYHPSSPTVALAELYHGLSSMPLGAKMVAIAGGDTGDPAYEAGGSVSMQKNKANAAGRCDTSPFRYLPEVDTDDAVKIWCSRRQPGQVTQSGPGAWLVEVEQERSISSGSEYDELHDEEHEEEASSEGRDDDHDGLRVDSPVGFAASVGEHPQVLRRPHKCHRGECSCAGY